MIIQNIRLYFEELERKERKEIKDYLIIALVCVCFGLIASIERF